MPEHQPLQQPRSKTDLFVSFTLLALQGFGGVLAIVGIFCQSLRKCRLEVNL